MISKAVGSQNQIWIPCSALFPKMKRSPSSSECVLPTDFASKGVLEKALNEKTLKISDSVLNLSILKGIIMPKIIAIYSNLF